MPVRVSVFARASAECYAKRAILPLTCSHPDLIVFRIVVTQTGLSPSAKDRLMPLPPPAALIRACCLHLRCCLVGTLPQQDRYVVVAQKCLSQEGTLSVLLQAG